MIKFLGSFSYVTKGYKNNPETLFSKVLTVNTFQDDYSMFFVDKLPTVLENLKDISYPDLIDLLAEQTSRYVKMIAGSMSTEEFENTKQMIEKIIEEIKSRPVTDVKDHETASNQK